MGCPGREFIFCPKVSCCQLSTLFVMLCRGPTRRPSAADSDQILGFENRSGFGRFFGLFSANFFYKKTKSYYPIGNKLLRPFQILKSRLFSPMYYVRSTYLYKYSFVHFIFAAFVSLMFQIQILRLDTKIGFSSVCCCLLKKHRQRYFTFAQHFKVKCNFGTQFFLHGAGSPGQGIHATGFKCAQ